MEDKNEDWKRGVNDRGLLLRKLIRKNLSKESSTKDICAFLVHFDLPLPSCLHVSTFGWSPPCPYPGGVKTKKKTKNKHQRYLQIISQIITWTQIVKIKKLTIGVNLLCKLNLLLPISSLLTVHKCSIRSSVEYGDVIFNQPNLSFLTNKIESFQYNMCLTISGVVRGTSKEELCQELGFESF